MIRINGEVINEYDLAAKILNEIFPKLKRKSKELTETVYWDYVLLRKFLDIEMVLNDFYMKFYQAIENGDDPCPYTLMKEFIVKELNKF